MVPPKREILKDISLSFFPGAKIGVLGLNGAGKSTLLRIMAGVDKEFDGEARPATGINIGYLPQEPQLDESKDVRGNVEDGIRELKDVMTRFDEISMKFAEPMSDDEMNALLEEQAELQNKIDAANGWDLERTLEIAAQSEVTVLTWAYTAFDVAPDIGAKVAICDKCLSEMWSSSSSSVVGMNSGVVLAVGACAQWMHWRRL
ncbi:MAG: ATP-binding cassette domain-containing protein, partial [Ketobacter sp.]